MTALRFQTACLLTVGLAALVGVGCSDESSNPVDPGDTTGIEEEFGGYTTSDETPGFGDPDLVAAMNEQTPAEDDLADDPETRDLEEDPATTTYAVTLRWGVLTGREAGDLGDEGTDPVDWSGSLRTTDGRVILTRLTSFEDGDYAIKPRTDPQRIDWVSETSGGSDGLSVLLHMPAADDDLEVDSVYVETTAYSVAFPVEDFEQMDVTFDVDAQGNQLRIHAMRADRVAPSARGWVLGNWGWNVESREGRFAGQWVHPRTGIVGFLRGHYGPEEGTDRTVFYGKYIDRDGTFLGLLRGTVEVTRGDFALGNGTFRGGWFSETGDESGAIQGRWATTGEGRGAFTGIWCSSCRGGDVGSIGF